MSSSAYVRLFSRSAIEAINRLLMAYNKSNLGTKQIIHPVDITMLYFLHDGFSST
jgi:hypothetical protein